MGARAGASSSSDSITAGSCSQAGGAASGRRRAQGCRDVWSQEKRRDSIVSGLCSRSTVIRVRDQSRLSGRPSSSLHLTRAIHTQPAIRLLSVPRTGAEQEEDDCHHFQSQVMRSQPAPRSCHPETHGVLGSHFSSREHKER